MSRVVMENDANDAVRFSPHPTVLYQLLFELQDLKILMIMVIKKYTKEENGRYERLRNMTDEEIRNNAKPDPDVPLKSEGEFEDFKPAKSRGRNSENNEG